MPLIPAAATSPPGLRLALLLLALALALALSGPLGQIGSERARQYNEGWNVVKQQEVLDGLALYRTPSGLTLTNYPPPAFHLAAGLAAATGLPPLAAGRAVSLAAFLAIGVLVGFAAWRLGAGGAGAAAAGLSFGVLGVATAENLVAVNEPHLLGLFFAMAGLACHLAPGGPRAAPAALCFALGVATKFCFVGAVVAIAADLMWRRDWRVIGRYLLFGLPASVALAAWTLLGEGPHALSHLFFARSISPYDAIAQAANVFTVSGPLIVASGLVAAALLWSRQAGSVLIAALAILPWPVMVFFAAGHGVARGIFLEAVALGLIAFFAGLGRLLREAPLPRQAAPAVALAVLLPSAAALAALPRTGWDRMRSAPAEAQLAALGRDAVARIAATPGDAMCEDLLVCHRAGKPHLYDPYAVDNAIRAGRFSAEAIAQMFRERRFAVIQLGIDHEVDLAGTGAMFRFPEPVAQAIRENYVAVLAHPRLAVLVPRP
jgi:hypothetical protein